jgi:arylsulfatase A-like enzyme
MTNYTIDTHSPLIVRAPARVRAGTRVDRLVEFVDVYPTLAELAGLPLPAQLEGTSAVPLLETPARAWKPAIFSQFLRDGVWAAPDGQPYMGYSLLTDRYHYVRWVNWQTKTEVARELYDREHDAAENTNIADRPEHAALVDALEAQRQTGWRAARPAVERSPVSPR